MMRAKLRRVGVMSCKGGAAARFGFDRKRKTFSAFLLLGFHGVWQASGKDDAETIGWDDG